MYYFCLQYHDFLKKRRDSCLLAGNNIELIEQTAKEAGGELYPWILKAVTTGTNWEIINPPYSAHKFRDMRRNFYCLLNLKK